MSKLISSVLCLLLVCSVVYGSSLRVESMGGVTICVRDEENDPIAVNPARVAIVETSKVLGSLAPEGRVSKSDSKEEYPVTPPLMENNKYFESENSASALDLNILGYLKPMPALGLGAQIDYRSESTKNLLWNKDVGKWKGRRPDLVYISTNTYEKRSEDTTELSPISLNLLGGYDLGIVALGLSINLQPGYKETLKTESKLIDNEYDLDISTTRVDSSKVETTRTNTRITAGALVRPMETVSIDVMLGLTTDNSESRQVSHIDNNVNVWEDDKDHYPVTKIKMSKIDIGLLLNYKLSDVFTVGAGLGISPGETTTTMEGKTFKYDPAKAKSMDITFVPGIGATLDKTSVVGVELGLFNSVTEIDNFEWRENKAKKASTEKTTMNVIFARAGAEKYLIEDFLAIRLGAVKIISSTRETETKDEIVKRVDKETFHTYGPMWTPASDLPLPQDYFSAGLALKVTENIVVEYGLIDALGMPLTKHQVLAKVAF